MIVDSRPNSMGEPGGAVADPLSLLLQDLSLSNWTSGESRLTSPMAATIPQGIGAFYVVRFGGCQLTVDGVSSSFLERGDVVLMLFGSQHRLSHDPTDQLRPYQEVFSNRSRSELHADTTAGERTSTLLHAHFDAGSFGVSPVEGGLPLLAHLRYSECPFLASYAHLFNLIAQEQVTQQPGWQTSVNQMVRVLFTQAIRLLVTDTAPGENHESREASSWLRASMDALIGPAIGLIHAEPQKPWTVLSLARAVEMSRSSFSERFRQVVGIPPMQYLTESRMRKACEMLNRTDNDVKQIASLVGYESPSSFTTAFKRWAGQSPAAYRKSVAKSTTPIS